MYLKLKLQKAFKNSDDNLHFDNTPLIVSCRLESNLKKETSRRAHDGNGDILESLVPPARAPVSDLGKSSSAARLPAMLKCPPKSKNPVFIAHCTK